MKFIKALVAVILAATAAAAFADPPAQVGRLSYQQGTVSFDAADTSNDWMAAQLNWPVTSGDRLWSDRDGRAELRIGSTAIRAGALTSVDVLRLDDSGTQLRLAQGALNIRLRHLDAGDTFEISTPAGAVLLTRPGSYRVAVDPAGATTAVLVRQGQADVLTGNAPVILRDQQSVSLSAAGQDLAGLPAPDEFDHWTMARDGQEERVVATRYVSPAMTGHEDLDQHGTWHSEPQYGHVWIPAAAALPVGWAPYSHGRWVWVSPWGWTWVDNAPWGFAPYHYGRWVRLGPRWAWAPGTRVARPVYAPALVAFVGGNNWSVSVNSGPTVGWVPLGWREPYIPWYRYSPAYVRNVNVAHVTNINVIHHYSNVTNVTRIRHVHRDVPSATTVIARDAFVSARPVHQARLAVSEQALASAHVTHALPVTRPAARHSLITEQPGARLPAAIAAREVVAAREPVTPARVGREGRNESAARPGTDERPRVRVLNAQGIAPAPSPVAPPVGALTPPQGERARAAEREQRRHPETRPGETPTAAAPAAQQGAATAPPTDRLHQQQERQVREAQQQRAQQEKHLQEQRTQQQQQERLARDAQQRQAQQDKQSQELHTQQQQQERQAREAQQRQAQQDRQSQEQRAQQLQQERQAREAQQRQVQQDRQSQEQRAQQQQQERQAREAQQRQVQQDRQSQEHRAQQQQQERQARAEQQRQAHAQQQQQQQHLQAQREQQHQVQQQRAAAVQQQRERQSQQVQQVEQQRQGQRQERREEREGARRAPPPQDAAAQQARAARQRADAERPQGR